MSAKSDSLSSITSCWFFLDRVFGTWFWLFSASLNTGFGTSLKLVAQMVFLLGVSGGPNPNTSKLSWLATPSLVDRSSSLSGLETPSWGDWPSQVSFIWVLRKSLALNFFPQAWHSYLQPLCCSLQWVVKSSVLSKTASQMKHLLLWITLDLPCSWFCPLSAKV